MICEWMIARIHNPDNQRWSIFHPTCLILMDVYILILGCHIKRGANAMWHGILFLIKMYIWILDRTHYDFLFGDAIDCDIAILNYDQSHAPILLLQITDTRVAWKFWDDVNRKHTHLTPKHELHDILISFVHSK